MGLHDFLVPIRFLALLGEFLVSLLALYAVRDNVLISLPYEYAQSDFDDRLHLARAAVYLLFACVGINAISFFGGFSTFHVPLSLFHITFHAVGSVLVALTVMNRGHYLYLWYIVGVFACPQLLCDLWCLTAASLRTRKIS